MQNPADLRKSEDFNSRLSELTFDLVSRESKEIEMSEKRKY